MATTNSQEHGRSSGSASRLITLAHMVQTICLRQASRRPYSTISNEKRSLIMHAIDTIGMSVTEAAKHYQVSRSTISSIKHVYENEDGRTTKKTNHGKRVSKLSDDQKHIVRQWVDNNCLLTLSEIRRECQGNSAICQWEHDFQNTSFLSLYNQSDIGGFRKCISDKSFKQELFMLRTI